MTDLILLYLLIGMAWYVITIRFHRQKEERDGIRYYSPGILARRKPQGWVLPDPCRRSRS